MIAAPVHPVRRGPGVLLHARSRGLYPTGAALLALAVAAPLAARALAAADLEAAATTIPNLQVLAAVAGVALTGPGFAGADADLETSTPRDRAGLRLTHLAVALVTVTAVLAAGRQPVPPPTDIGTGTLEDLVVLGRDVAGLLGLQALTAAVFGARVCWFPPILWVLVLLAVGPRQHGWRLVASMPSAPAAATTAAVTAAVLLLVGAGAYARRDTTHRDTS